MDLSRVVVFVGESGDPDTDYEELLGGVHKSLILKGVCSGASTAASFIPTEAIRLISHVVALDSPNVVQAIEDCGSDELIGAFMEQLGVLNS